MNTLCLAAGNFAGKISSFDKFSRSAKKAIIRGGAESNPMRFAEKQDAKHKITGALEFIMQTRPLSKISVSEIMDKCGLSRQTFYRNFTDIYDLVNWLHAERNQLSFDIFKEHKDIVESFEITLKMMVKYKNFYRHIVSLEGPNSFSAFFSGQIFNACKAHIGENRLNPEILISIKLYSVGAAKIVVDWINNWMDIPAKVLAKYLYKGMPYNLIRFYNNNEK